MHKDYDKLSNIKGKIDDSSFSECIETCDKVCIIDNEKYCMDKKCRSTKKRLYKRRKNDRLRIKWLDLEVKLTNSNKKLYDDSIFPYLAIEAVIRKTYDEELLSFIAKKLGIANKDMKKTGVNKIYELNDIEVKRLYEITVLRALGLDRAENIFKSKVLNRG